MEQISEPVENVDFFTLKVCEYLIETTTTHRIRGEENMTAEELLESAGLSSGEWNEIVQSIDIGTKEVDISDPTKPFDREAWKYKYREEHGLLRPYEKQRPESEKTLEDF